jgi:hypothetical protein
MCFFFSNFNSGSQGRRTVRWSSHMLPPAAELTYTQLQATCHITSPAAQANAAHYTNDDRTEILFRARDGIAAPVGGKRVDKSTLLCGVDCGVSSSAGDTLLSVDSLSGVGVAEEEEATCGIGKSDAGRLRREPVLFGPATVWVAQALSIAPQRHRFSSFFAIPSRLPLVW